VSDGIIATIPGVFYEDLSDYRLCEEHGRLFEVEVGGCSGCAGRALMDMEFIARAVQAQRDADLGPGPLTPPEPAPLPTARVVTPRPWWRRWRRG
jgi:hypothetical protein